MRLSHLLWIVALFIVVRAGSTHQHPRMMSKREGSHATHATHAKRSNSDCGHMYKRHGGNHVKRQYNAKIWDSMPDEGLQGNAAPNCATSSPEIPCPVCPSAVNSASSGPSANPLPQCMPSSYDAQSRTNANAPMTQQQQQQQQQQLPQQAPYQSQIQQLQQMSVDSDLDDAEKRGKELRQLVQHLYVAQARVQLEATEIHKAQAVATSAQSQLEDSANHVRTITATLHNAQQEVAAAAIRAQIAQLQLAAHDQLLFAARQDVDALSSQVVGLQAAEGIVQPKLTVDLHALLNKLRQPLQRFDCPTPVPVIVTLPPLHGPAPVRQPGADEGSTGQDAETSQHIEEIAKPQQKHEKVARRMAKASGLFQPIHPHHA